MVGNVYGTVMRGSTIRALKLNGVREGKSGLKSKNLGDFDMYILTTIATPSEPCRRLGISWSQTVIRK